MATKAFGATCYAPFTSLFLDPHGDVRVCCQTLEHRLGNVQQDRLSDLWRGATMKAFRQGVQGTSLPQACERCRWEIELGNFEQTFARVFDAAPVGSAEPQWPLSIWFLMSNTCNLECVQCLGECSSAIRKNREGLPALPRVYKDAFFEELEAFLPHLRHAVFLGGEPFLIAENFRVWDMLIQRKLSPSLLVVTNGTVFTERVERVLGALPCSISVSLDGASKGVVESIRRNASFDEILDNVARFKRLTERAGTQLDLSFCLMEQNEHELIEFLALAERLGCGASVNVIYEPHEFSLLRLSASRLAEIACRWESEEAIARSRLTRHFSVWAREFQRLRQWANAKQADSQAGPRLRLPVMSVG